MLDLAADMTDRAWEDVLRGCSTLVHCAAHVHHPVETAADRDLFSKVNSQGTERLLLACERAGIHRFVLSSTMAFYDWPASAKAKQEDDPVAPSTAYARSKLESDCCVQASSLDWRIGRLGTVYGVGDRANFARLAAAMRRRRFVLPDRGSARKSVLPVPKAGELLGRLATMPDLGGTIVNLAAPIAPSLAEICSAFETVCGFPRPRSIPSSLLQLAAWAGDSIVGIGGRCPLTSDALKKLTTSTVIDVSRMQSIFTDLNWDSFENTLQSAADYYAQAAGPSE